MSEKVLSVSVAAYNLENMISQNLESWISEDVMDKLEILITDDGSKDNTVNIVKKYEDKYPNTFKLICQKNSGPGSTVNSGIINATGKYFRMVDGDDWVEKKNLKEYIDILEKNDVDMILTNYEVYNNSTDKIIDTVKMDIEPNKIYKFDDISEKIYPKMHNVTYKTSILKENNIKLDNGFYTDVEYLLLPLQYINSVMYLDINIYIYRIGQATQSVSIPSMQKNIGMHAIVLDRMVNYFEENKKNISLNKQLYLKKQIATVADAHLGTLLTFKMNKDIKEKIINFNKKLKNRSEEIYCVYKKSKKAKILIFSNYLFCPLLSKVYIKKLNKI